jgi:colicin import membrane protein
MPHAADRADFAPPPQPAALQAFLLAVIAHLLLLMALTWGINWKRESENVVAEAELWSTVPQQAAPKVVQAPPIVAAPKPVPAPPPPPPPPPAPREVAPPPPPVPAKQPDIALEREKKRQELAERRREELEQQKKLEARREREEAEREKKAEARRKEEQLKREQLAQQKAAEEKERKKKEELAKAKAKQEEAKLAALRQENLRRMQGLAGKGPQDSPGDAERSAGPSASYAGRIAAKIKPNIVFTDVISGNPAATVEIRVAPDGTIVGSKLVHSSGVKSWDEAVLRAIDKTEVLPRDTDGRVVPKFPITFRPRD